MAVGQVVLDHAEDTGNRVDLPVANGLPFGRFVRLTLTEAERDRLPAFAGNVAFHALFACFPCLFTLFWFLEASGGKKAVNDVTGLITTALPKAAGQAVKQQLAGATGPQSSGAITLGACVALLVSVWAIMQTFRATMDAMNVMFECRESRPLWKRYVVALLLSVVTAALLVAAVGVVVFGSAVAHRLGQATGSGPILHWAWEIVSWPVIVLCVLGAFALTYYFAPDVKQAFHWITGGSLLAAALWLIFTISFSVYVNNFSAPTQTYGALAGIAVLMLYLYGTAYVLLLGAEMNRVIQVHGQAHG